MPVLNYHLAASYIVQSIFKVLYSGKFSKGLIFENFESSQAFSKIFFQN